MLFAVLRQIGGLPQVCSYSKLVACPGRIIPGPQVTWLFAAARLASFNRSRQNFSHGGTSLISIVDSTLQSWFCSSCQLRLFAVIVPMSKLKTTLLYSSRALNAALTNRPPIHRSKFVFLAAVSLADQIWDISADPNLNYLRRGDFYVAMRLIATAQVRVIS